MVRSASQTISNCAGASGALVGSSNRDGHCQRI